MYDSFEMIMNNPGFPFNYKITQEHLNIEVQKNFQLEFQFEQIIDRINKLADFIKNQMNLSFKSDCDFIIQTHNDISLIENTLKNPFNIQKLMRKLQAKSNEDNTTKLNLSQLSEIENNIFGYKYSQKLKQQQIEKQKMMKAK